MAEDVLLRVREPLAVALVNVLLRVLTHPRLLVRRLAYLGFLAILYLIAFEGVQTSVRGQQRLRRLTRQVLAEDDAHTPFDSPYVPAEPTAVQEDNHQLLSHLIDSLSSAYYAPSFEDSALRQDSSKVVGTTAVLLHWKRKRGLQLVVKHISRYPFIREIIIWNNRNDVHLTQSDFEVLGPPETDLDPPILRIYNSPSNVHDSGKHFACSLATYRHCYFNDDDWLNIYMDSLYTKYLDCCAGGGGRSERGGSGGRIASNTMPIIHLEHRRWRFDNAEHDLHTGFTWLGTGAFAPRYLSIRFLNQQGALPTPLSPSQTLVSDMFFSLWSNTYPEQMPNNLVPIDVEGAEVGWSRSAQINQWAIVYANILDGVRRLYDILQLRDPFLSPTPFPMATPPKESDARAPCSNDGCLFLTSMSPFPHPASIEYAYSKKARRFRLPFFGPGSPVVDGPVNPWAISHVHEQEGKFNEHRDGWPDDDWWTKKGSWHLAVDGEGADTCWQSWKAPSEHDYFGLRLVAPRYLSQVTVIGTTQFSNVRYHDRSDERASVDRREAWQIMTLSEGSSNWEIRNLLGRPLITAVDLDTGDEHPDDMPKNVVQVTFNLAPLTLASPGVDQAAAVKREKAITAIKFMSTGLKREKISVCGFELDGWKV